MRSKTFSLLVLTIIILVALGLASTSYSSVTAQDGEDVVVRTVVFPIDDLLRGETDLMADLSAQGFSMEEIAWMRRSFEQDDTRGPVSPS